MIGTGSNIADVDMPSGGYNPLRIALNPNDPDYLKKLGLIGIVEGTHEVGQNIKQQKQDDAQKMQTGQPPVMGRADDPTDAPEPAGAAPLMGQPPAPQGDPFAGSKAILSKPTATQSLMQKAQGIHNRPLRVLGEIGAGALEGGEALGESMFPTVAAQIPGTFMNRQLMGKQEFGREEAEEQERIRATQEQIAQERANNPVIVQQMRDTDVDKRIASSEKQTQERLQNQFKIAMTKPQAAAFDNMLTGNNGGPQINPETGAPYTEVEAYQALQKPPSEKPVAGTLDGKEAWGLYAPNSGWIDPQTKKPIPNFAPNESWAQNIAPTHTMDMFRPDGFIHTMGFDPQTKRYDIDQGISGKGAVAGQIFQAGTVGRSADTLIDDIKAVIQAHKDDPKKDALGTIDAWVKKYGLNTPIADPVLAQLQAELGSFAALQPAMHHFRAASAMESFHNLIGDLQKNPDTTIASIQGILRGAVAPLTPPGMQSGSTKAASGATRVINID